MSSPPTATFSVSPLRTGAHIRSRRPLRYLPGVGGERDGVDPMMWQATLRDLQWRRRRFLIAVTGTALVFAMSLLMSGLAASFTLETDRALESIGADVWVVHEGASGPFTAFSPIPATDAERVAAVDGITAADPIIYVHQTIGDDPEDINLFGVVRGGIGEPELTDGRALEGPGKRSSTASSASTSARRSRWAAQEWEVVGETKNTTINGGIPTVFIGIDDAQELSVDWARSPARSSRPASPPGASTAWSS